MSARPSERTTATREDIRSILGDLDDTTTLEILGLNPSVSDLEEALMWSSGSGGDVLVLEFLEQFRIVLSDVRQLIRVILCKPFVGLALTFLLLTDYCDG